jgi:hypothetical protein
MGLCVANGHTAGAGSQWVFAASGSAPWAFNRNNWTNFNSAGGTNVVYGGQLKHPSDLDTLEVYVRLRRVGTTISWAFSKDGEFFQAESTVTEATLGFTISDVGPFARNNATAPLDIAFRYVRAITGSGSVHKFGSLRRIALTT